jgi:signal transduction histidine kinase
MQTCLSGRNAEMLEQDYRDVAIIHGFRFIPEIGGGCIMAHFDQAEAFAPLTAFRWRIGVMVVLFLALAVAAAITIARSIITPVASLTQAIRAFSLGRTVTPLDTKAPGELGELARSFTAMRIAVGESERAMRTSLRNAEIANRTKSEFLANMSHELRTPLNAIIGFSEVLRTGIIVPVEGKVKSYCNDIHSAGQHLLSIVNDSLEIAKIEAGHVELDRETLDAGQVALSCLAMMSERARSSGVTFGHAGLESLPPVSADRTRLMQILINLLSNAVKFTQEGGQVTVTGSATADSLRLAISDTGIGISPEHLARIGEPFYQVEPASSRHHGGTGLGLALAREMAEMHGGHLEIKSELGHGTTVTLILPLDGA